MSQFFEWIANLFKGARFWQVVLPWESAVRVRAGKHALVWGPGIHLRVPYLDDVSVVNNRLRLAASPCQTVSTNDGKAVTVAASVGFRVVDPLKAMLRMQAAEDASAVFVQTAMAHYLSRRPLASINVEDLEAAALKAAAAFGGQGLEFEFVRVTDFAVVRTIRLLQEQWRPNTGHRENL